MADIKLGYGIGIKATLLTPAGAVCDLRDALYVNAVLTLPNGSTMYAQDIAVDRVTNAIYVRLLADRELTAEGNYRILFNVKLADGVMYSTVAVNFADVTTDANAGYKELSLSFSLEVTDYPQNVERTGASPKVSPRQTWLVYNDEAKAYEDTGIPAEVNLSDYYTKEETDAKVAEVTNTLLLKLGSETNEGLLNVEYIPRTYVDITNGELVEYAGYKSTDYINLGNVSKIKVKWSAGYQYNMFYDEQKKPIIKNGGWYFDTGENIYNVPQNAAYLRMSQSNGVMDGLSISVAEYRTMAIERKITEIPTYYESYLVKKVEEINKVHLNSGRYNDSFVFITDTHWFKNQMMSPSLVKYIAEHTTCKKLLFGGDACGGELKDSPTIGREQAMKHIEVMSGIAQSVGVYQARGNHDFWGFSTSFVDANGLKNDAVANAIMFPLNNNVVGNDKSETNGCYYYFDVDYAKIRYVVLDLFDYIGKTDYSSWANNILHVITNEQKEWIANNALKNAPEGYSIVMMAHISPLAIMSEGYGYYAAVKQMIDAYNARQAWNGISFADSKGKVICYVNGHQHQDIQAYSNGVCYVGTASDAYYTADISSCVFTQSANRESGSVTEQVLDVFNIDISNEVIDCTRIGCAYNRKMHLETVTKSVGQTYKIIPTIAAVKYGVYDNDAPTNTITNNYASINGNVVTCNSVGEVTCYAEDAEHNKEFFSIKIVA